MDEPTLLNMSCGLRKFAFCIYKQRHRSVEGGGNCAAAIRVGDKGSGTPSSIFNVLLCNLSSFCPIFN